MVNSFANSSWTLNFSNSVPVPVALVTFICFFTNSGWVFDICLVVNMDGEKLDTKAFQKTNKIETLLRFLITHCVF